MYPMTCDMSETSGSKSFTIMSAAAVARSVARHMPPEVRTKAHGHQETQAMKELRVIVSSTKGDRVIRLLVVTVASMRHETLILNR